jgi:hypothetical protein
VVERPRCTPWNGACGYARVLQVTGFAAIDRAGLALPDSEKAFQSLERVVFSAVAPSFAVARSCSQFVQRLQPFPELCGTSASGPGRSVSRLRTSSSGARTSSSRTGTSLSRAGTSLSRAGTSSSRAGTSLSRAGTSLSRAGTSPSRAGTSLSRAGTSPSRAGTSPSRAGTSLSRAGTSLSRAGTSPSRKVHPPAFRDEKIDGHWRSLAIPPCPSFAAPALSSAAEDGAWPWRSVGAPHGIC